MNILTFSERENMIGYSMSWDYISIGCSDESMTIDLYLIYVAELQAAKND